MIWPERFVTDRLVLRRPVASDAPVLFEEYAQDPTVTRHLTWRPHARLDESRSYLARCEAGWNSGTDLTWALTLAGSDRLIGMIALRPRGHMADIGYVLARAHWGKGLMSEAGRAIVDWALGNPAVHRVWAVCDIENRASARVMEKLGMTHEGVLRRWIVHPNISPLPRDVHCYARVRETAGGS
jgi:[ribosomal protein S5]-alanine N-acetyltransferase